MVILSTGLAVGNPRYYAKDEKRLAKGYSNRSLEN
jgi:hypothetical protein